jgi:hypothetical protein
VALNRAGQVCGTGRVVHHELVEFGRRTRRNVKAKGQRAALFEQAKNEIAEERAALSVEKVVRRDAKPHHVASHNVDAKRVPLVCLGRKRLLHERALHKLVAANRRHCRDTARKAAALAVRNHLNGAKV